MSPSEERATRHWHAYAYTGRSYGDGAIRRREVPADYPPIEIKDWLRRPGEQVVATYADVEAAVAWIEGELTQNAPVDLEHFPLWDRLRHTRETLRLAAGSDVVQGYYSKAQQYLSRALITCPREEGQHCPYGGGA
ncbi:hypothetical protein J7E93_19340 [Streptomyces sp. ISL-36]|uniref:hypothetical protein n=1 Tax=Streptomyces sp. ISL-36 TaxID=2819182 RepID=UPI001BEABF4A|nr:hypothetical protein [Streptomyces sp. ISL-36]MBT2442219.1 hypothetical protein [Streptomyces sp. ISL-36]